MICLICSFRAGVLFVESTSGISSRLVTENANGWNLIKWSNKYGVDTLMLSL